jgi:hypothetical protein
MATPERSARVERLAHNEARFREINERLSQELKRFPGELGDVDFVCECGRRDCRESVTLSAEQYEAVRAVSAHFAVVPGHEISDVERIVGGDARHSVVEKIPEVDHIVEATDPRR